MSTLHKKAFAEAKQLREIALKNAQNAIIENITPEIKNLIEKSLLGEDIMDDDNILMDLGMPQEAEPGLPGQSELAAPQGEPAIQAVSMAPAVEEPMVSGEKSCDNTAAITLPDEQGKVTLDLDNIDLVDDDQVVNLTTEHVKTLAGLLGASSEQFGVRIMNLSNKFNKLVEDKEIESISRSEKYKQLRTETENIFHDLKESTKKGTVPVEVQILTEENLNRIYKDINKAYVPITVECAQKDCLKLVEHVSKMDEICEKYDLNDNAKKIFGEELVKQLKEAISIYEVLNDLKTNLKEDSVSVFLENVGKLCKEIYQMSNKAKIALNEEEMRVILHGLPDGLSLEDINVSVEPMGGALSDDMEGDEELDSSELDLGADDEGDVDMPELEPSDDMDDMDMGSDDEVMDEMDLGIDLDMPDGVEVDAGDVSAKLAPMDDDMDMGSDDMGDDMSNDMGDEMGDDMDMGDDEMVEISETELAEAIKEMKKARLSESSDCDVKSEPHSFDGRDHGPENEEDFGGGSSIGEPFVDVDSLSLSESEEDEESDDEEDLKESRKELEEKVLSYKRMYQSTKKKLDEAILLNVKMEAANKLMQNENLTKQQRLTIVHALDSATSVKEVQKLFATMNEAFSDKRTKGRSLSEGVGTKIVGGSSKAQKSGGATILQESLSDPEKVEFGRWGELAGIK